MQEDPESFQNVFDAQVDRISRGSAERDVSLQNSYTVSAMMSKVFLISFEGCICLCQTELTVERVPLQRSPPKSPGKDRSR